MVASYNFAPRMIKVPIKYVFILFVMLQCGFVQLKGEIINNIGSHFSIHTGEVSEYNGLAHFSENKYSLNSAFSTLEQDWQIAINEFERRENSENDSSREHSETKHPFSVFLAISSKNAYYLQYIKAHLSAKKHFSSFTCLYLSYQVFRL